jgi:ABC-type multidrug transport system ATPase subunit
MKITLQNIGKRYNREWIFKKVDTELSSDHSYVILGSNGSGKSTLLQLLSGYIIPSEGTINYQVNGNEISPETIFKQVSIATPYQELFEDFTLIETLQLHGKFKSIDPELNFDTIADLFQLEKAKNKAIKNYSSGMKQRVKLGLAFISETPLLLLDEPTSNLDKKGIDWYLEMVNRFKKDKLVVVCSNQQEQEYAFCDQQIDIENYK